MFLKLKDSLKTLSMLTINRSQITLNIVTFAFLEKKTRNIFLFLCNKMFEVATLFLDLGLKRWL